MIVEDRVSVQGLAIAEELVTVQDIVIAEHLVITTTTYYCLCRLHYQSLMSMCFCIARNAETHDQSSMVVYLVEYLSLPLIDVTGTSP